MCRLRPRQEEMHCSDTALMQVYDVAIDTIILAFCEDCDAHDGHPKHAPALLLDALGYAKEAHEALSERRQAPSGSQEQFIQRGGYGAA